MSSTALHCWSARADAASQQRCGTAAPGSRARRRRAAWRIEAAGAAGSRLIVVLERLVDGHNYSAIFRTCEALGVQHVCRRAAPGAAARGQSRSAGRRRRNARGNTPRTTRTGGRARPGGLARTAAAEAGRRLTADARSMRNTRFMGEGRAFLSVRDRVPRGGDRGGAGRAALRLVLGPGPGRLRAGRRRVAARPLPHRVALVFGTQSTASERPPGGGDRRVYVPQHARRQPERRRRGGPATSHVLKFWGRRRPAGGDGLVPEPS